MAPVRLFRPDREAILVSRPNRFVVMAESEGESLRCHCPNPGRMLELALPGARLILEAGRAGRATAWTAAAERYRGEIVPLAPGRTNAAARELLVPGLWPELRGLRGEVSYGASRFDFAAEDRRGRGHLIEVKTCSLVERGLALFPDAPSARATRHLGGLAEAAAEGLLAHVLFVVVHGGAACLAPNVHTDRAFAFALAEAAARGVELRAAEIVVDESGTVAPDWREIPVDLGPVALAAEDRGSCLVCFSLDAPASISVGGRKGSLPPGRYVYGPPPRERLSDGVARLLGRRRSGFELLDELAGRARNLAAFPVLSSRSLDPELVEGIAGLGGSPVPGPEEAPRGEPCRLYRLPSDPLSSRPFVELILSLRHSLAFGAP